MTDVQNIVFGIFLVWEYALNQTVSSSNPRTVEAELQKVEAQVEKYRHRYQIVYNLSKKYSFLEPYEKKVNAMIVVAFFFLSLIRYFLKWLGLDAHLPENAIVTIEFVEWIIRLIAFGLMISQLYLFYLQYKSDSWFRIFADSWQNSFESATYVLPKVNSRNIALNYSECTQPITGFYSRHIDESNWMKEIDLIVQLAVTAYGTKISPVIRRAVFRDWYQANPNCFVILYENLLPIGYLCLLPLKDGAKKDGKKHYHGECDEFDITKGMITTNSTTHILFQGGYLKPIYLKSREALRLIKETFCQKVADSLGDDNDLINDTIIYAQPATSNQNVLFSKMGFTPSLNFNISNNNIYELPFSKEYHLKHPHAKSADIIQHILTLVDERKERMIKKEQPKGTVQLKLFN